MGTRESRSPVSNGNKNPRVIQSYHLENDYTFFFAEFNKKMLHLVKETPDLNEMGMFIFRNGRTGYLDQCFY